MKTRRCAAACSMTAPTSAIRNNPRHDSEECNEVSIPGTRFDRRTRGNRLRAAGSTAAAATAARRYDDHHDHDDGDRYGGARSILDPTGADGAAGSAARRAQRTGPDFGSAT